MNPSTHNPICIKIMRLSINSYRMTDNFKTSIYCFIKKAVTINLSMITA